MLKSPKMIIGTIYILSYLKFTLYFRNSLFSIPTFNMNTSELYFRIVLEFIILVIVYHTRKTHFFPLYSLIENQNIHHLSINV